MKISQSMFKEWQDYQNQKSCGLQFEAKYVTKNWEREQSEVQAAGWWFEDMAVRGKSDVQPTTLKGGGMNALYRYLWNHIEVCREMLKDYTYTSNQRISFGEVEGTPDIVTMNGVIIDIKTSAHLNNKWDSYGWAALVEGDEESFKYKLQLQDKRIQALTYCFIARSLQPVYDNINMFEYWVFSNNSDDCKRFRLWLSDDEITDWGAYLHIVLGDIKLEQQLGFSPVPSFSRCKLCQLRANCLHSQKLPDTIEI